MMMNCRLDSYAYMMDCHRMGGRELGTGMGSLFLCCGKQSAIPLCRRNLQIEINESERIPQKGLHISKTETEQFASDRWPEIMLHSTLTKLWFRSHQINLK